MYAALVVLHVIVGLGLIGLILLQQGKGADAGVAFGSGASATVFGARGAASFLTKATVALVVLFFTNSFALNYMGTRVAGQKDIVKELEQPSTDVIESEIKETNDTDDVIKPPSLQDTAPEEIKPAPNSDTPELPAAEQKEDAAPSDDTPAVKGEAAPADITPADTPADSSLAKPNEAETKAEKVESAAPVTKTEKADPPAAESVEKEIKKAAESATVKPEPTKPAAKEKQPEKVK
jgi:preprotein translocase subunit SecG